jgi:dTDP-4-dehydrorhamnose 3,5-epimerase
VKLEPLRLPGAWLIELEPRRDARGYFQRTYDDTLFAKHGLSTAWVQDNEAFNTQTGIVRGLHFQRPPHAETKLVRVVEGAIWDVILDLRAGSPTFGQWHGVELDARTHRMLYVPRGFAHGYSTLTPTARVLYKVDAHYAPEAEGGVRFDDPALAISWRVEQAIVSDKDRQWPTLAELQTPLREPT